MKKLLITAMTLFCFAFSSYGQGKVEKQIIGNGAILIPTSLQVNSKDLNSKKEENALLSISLL